MTNKLGWFEGKWGSEKELFIPLLNQGITRGYGIFETILILKGKPQLLKKHLNRWQRSAYLLKMKEPPNEEFLSPLIKQAVSQFGLSERNGVLKLNWSSRNLNIQEKNSATYDFWLEISQKEPYFDPISTLISKTERRNTNSVICKCKSFQYLQSIQAKYEAQTAGYNDALLLSTNGEISCGTTANLLIRRNEKWLTPPLSSGCLPGIMREQALETGLIEEAIINKEPQEDDQWLLINSLSCRPIKSVNSKNLKTYKKAKDLWFSLLKIIP